MLVPHLPNVESLVHASEIPVQMVVADSDQPGLSTFISRLRNSPEGIAVPLIVRVPAVSEHLFTQAYAMGADDVIAQDDYGALTRRAASLADFDPRERPLLEQGKALIVHQEVEHRAIWGRLLRLAGFDLDFASDERELPPPCSAGYAIAVTQLRTLDSLQHTVDCVRRNNPITPCILIADVDDGERLAALREEAAQLIQVAVVHHTSPAEHLLFISNEMLAGPATNWRSSRRVLYDALCSYRASGELLPGFGVTYNISREGLYLRTLDPPKTGTEVWLEIRPYAYTRAVHLRGRVVWSRTLERKLARSTPIGCGIRLNEEETPYRDLEIYRSAYDQLCQVG